MPQPALRLFAAVQIPNGLRPRLIHWAKNTGGSFQKWSHPEDLHITLFFLGDTAADKLSSVHSALEQAAAGLKPFQLRLSGAGTFGPGKSPSVLWTGVDGDLTSLQTLQAQVTASLSQIGYVPEERPYRPHLTLARRYNGAVPWDIAATALQSFPDDLQSDWPCSEITLYRSHLGKSPMYEAVGRYPLF